MIFGGHILFSAESEGFEPPVQLPVHRISSAARSTTPAAFLGSFIYGYKCRENLIPLSC